MADNITKVPQEKRLDADLPLPPPPESLQHSVTGAQDQSFMPPPPPKESFSKFYEQRQVNELKRLYRHMHPELRKNLEHAVTTDINELLSTDEPNQQASINLDAVLPGEVQSMRWIFENWNLDTIGEHQGSRKLTEEESVLGGDVKNRSLRFQNETCIDSSNSTSLREGQTKGDVKTALWLFETQPLDSLNKIYPEDTDMQEAVLKDPVEKGDVKGTKMLFETQSLDEVGRCNSVEENRILQLKSEVQQTKGDISKTIKLFQTEPLCAIRDQTGNIHEIKSICREETQDNNVNTARWLFETQPLDTINKDTSKVQLIRGISLEEIAKGGVNAAKWIFETQPLDTIKEHMEEGVFQASIDTVQGTDASKQCNVFDKQYLDSINGNTENQFASKEEILPGDVKSTLWMFETQPMERLKGSMEVGQLKKVELLNEERGDVKQMKHAFETCALDRLSNQEGELREQFGKDTKEIVKGEVKTFKNLFETYPLDNIKASKSVHVSEQEDMKIGNVKANQALFENTPLYAIEDSLGNYHEVTSVSREQEISGDVKNYKWMFETRPLDQFNDGIQKVDIIKGITKQEIMSGDVGTAKWLFETQPTDVFSKDSQGITQKEVLQKGDVKKCRWLFETQPIDMLYDKSEKPQKEALVQGDVKSYTWMFETQPLDAIKDSEERYIRVNSVCHGDLGVSVKTTKHLFETEPLESNSSVRQFPKMIRYASRVEIQSGEVSRVKEIFESKPNEKVNLLKENIPAEENIQVGSVNKFTWLFENCPMDSLKVSKDGFQELPPEREIQGGDVGGKKFIFETYSLDQIHQESDEQEIMKVQESLMKGDVKSCTMLFESKPLYAIQDKGGEYHEVTSVKKEEIQKGDVRGAKWLFETKPLDRINKDEEVFVIRAVTQEDIEKGCVKAARWRFETEPLDAITDIAKCPARTVDDVQKGDVLSNKQLFETEQVSQKKYVRLVSVSDVQKGNVRTSTWLFENQPIDSLKGEDQEHKGIVKVQREDNQKGDVKRSTWLFESQPLDSLKDTESPADFQATEDIPQANVKSTTWLFESTPLDKFDSTDTTSIEQREITVKDTLDAFFSCKIIQNKGIVIENIHGGNVKMTKFQSTVQCKADIQKEEIVGGNLQRILLQLLHRTDIEPYGLLVEESGSGHLQMTGLNLLETIQSREEDKECIRDDVAKALKILLNEDTTNKTGIIMEESERGSVKIIIYSISSTCKFHLNEEVIAKGDVKSTIGSLLACSQESKAKVSVTRDEIEKGNVQLYTSCIEKGDLDYLKSLQAESEIDALAFSQSQPKFEGTVDSEKHSAGKQSDNQSTGGPECVYITSTPVFHPVQPTEQVKSYKMLDTTGTTDVQKAIKGCKVAKKDIILSDTKRNVTNVQETKVSKCTSEQKSQCTSVKQCCVGASLSNTAQSQCNSSDLQAALSDLRLATAEAKSIQKQVQCKIQRTNQETQLTKKDAPVNNVQPIQATLYQECTATKHTTSAKIKVQEKQTSYSSVQKSTASTKKVSVSQEEEKEATREDSELSRSGNMNKDDDKSPKQERKYLNPFSDYDYKTQLEQEESEEIVRGDVKAAIRALQNASAEQRAVEKEEVVKGNLTSTLQSLQKSNVNISKGDFKAAVIYRNAGQSYAASKRKSESQQIKNEGQIKSVQPSDNDFHPSSAAVIGQESCQASNASNVEARKDDTTKANDQVVTIPAPINQKASENTPDVMANAENKSVTAPRKKPVPPPKPKHLLPGTRPPPRRRPKVLVTSTPASSPMPSILADNSCSTILTDPESMSKEVNSSIVGSTELVDAYLCIKECEGSEKQTLSSVAACDERLTKDQTCKDVCKSIPDSPTTEKLLNECSTSSVNDVKFCTTEQGQLETISEDNPSAYKSINNEEKTLEKTSVDETDSKCSYSNSDSKGVVMRVKKRRETEDEKRKRLSIHMDEIMKENVKAATDIFENLRKQDELEMILKKVEEIEDTSTVDVKSVKGLFETVPDWVASSKETALPIHKQNERHKDESFELLKDDTESVSSVELAFEDLEKASAEIKHLKEQTLARLLDIEETIKKALYSVSNLKSDSDITSLSSLFRESLESASTTSNNIRKISIVSSKSKPDKLSQMYEQKYLNAVNNQEMAENRKTELVEVTAVPSRLSPTSPSFITIESAARKPTHQNGSCPSSLTSMKNIQECKDPFSQSSTCNDNKQCSSTDLLRIPAVPEQNNESNLTSPSSPSTQRQKSVLELKTGLEGPKVIGTTIVSEKYEESDQYGNKIIRSKTSTTVTKQSDTQSSSTYEVVSSHPRYEVTSSPLLRKHAMSAAENPNSTVNNTGVVFVTFANSKPAK